MDMKTISLATPEEQAKLQHQSGVEAHLEKLRIRDEAKIRRHTEAHPPQPLPVPRSLAHRLAQRQRPVTWRVENLFLEGQHNLLAAQFKAGKTTLVMNLVRSLVDGAAFLDKFQVCPVLRSLTIIDIEMAEDEPGQLDEWYRAAKIKNADRVMIIGLRGRAHLFNIIDPEIRSAWVNILKGTDFLIVDPARPILDALGLDENHEVGKLTGALDALCLEADIPEMLLVQHMGHQNERARGDSQYLAWPAVNWTLVRESDDPASKRFFKAYGRGVDVSEIELVFNPTTHRLGLGTGSRADIKAVAAIPSIVAFVQNEANPPTQSAIRKAVKANDDVHDKTARKAIRLAVRDGHLIEADGPNKNSKVYSVPPQP